MSIFDIKNDFFYFKDVFLATMLLCFYNTQSLITIVKYITFKIVHKEELLDFKHYSTFYSLPIIQDSIYDKIK